MSLRTDDELEASCVVANCRMNRERELTGSNGYEREIRLSPLAFLRERLAKSTEDEPDTHTMALFNGLLEADWSPEIESEALALIDNHWTWPARNSISRSPT